MSPRECPRCLGDGRIVSRLVRGHRRCQTCYGRGTLTTPSETALLEIRDRLNRGELIWNRDAAILVREIDLLEERLRHWESIAHEHASLFQRMIAGSLRSCIDAHGDITSDKIGSATKRIFKQLWPTVREGVRREMEDAA